ncbi:MAG: PEGA domain-containing protein [Lentisphaeria bacterium]|nr:PEGA domain-containing protein [Lentisphaeria bacterium]
MKKFALLFLTAALLLCSCGKKEVKRTLFEIRGPEGVSCVIDGIRVKSSKFSLLPGTYVMRFSAPGYRTEYRKVTVEGKECAFDPQLVPVRSSVLIKSTPAGATVVMDGQSRGITPLVIRDLPAGKYHAELSMRGYAGRPAEWEINSVRPVAVNVDLDSNMGALVITSSPSRARVIVDGTELGETPLTLERAEGKYVIRVERAGCNPEERNVRISRGQKDKIHVKLGQKPGGVRVTTTPAGAELFINGVKRGVTPCTVEALDPGVYNITLVRGGFDDLVSRVQIVPGATDTRHFNLVSSTGSVVFNIQPVGVEVFFRGKSLGVAKALVEGAESTANFTISNLPPGQHTVTMFHSLGDPPHQSFTFNVRKGKKTILKSRRMWLSNSEILYISGIREKGFLVESKPDYVVFSPEPGVQYRVDRSKIRKVIMLKGVKRSVPSR